MAENIILCGYLGICSCFDCRKRQIPIWLLRLGVGAGMAYALFLLAAGRAGWQTVLAGAAPGTGDAALQPAVAGKAGMGGRADGASGRAGAALGKMRGRGVCSLLSRLPCGGRTADRGEGDEKYKASFCPFFSLRRFCLCG